MRKIEWEYTNDKAKFIGKTIENDKFILFKDESLDSSSKSLNISSDNVIEMVYLTDGLTKTFLSLQLELMKIAQFIADNKVMLIKRLLRKIDILRIFIII